MLDVVDMSWVVPQIMKIKIWEKNNSITVMTINNLGKTATDEKGHRNLAMAAPMGPS